MKPSTVFIALVLAVGFLAASPAAQMSTAEQEALRDRIEARFDVVPLTEGVALRPKSTMRDVRLIEISETGIAINGQPVTGRELRDRVGSDADVILRVSYLSAGERRSLFRPTATDVEPPSAQPAERPAANDTGRARRRAHGDRVRVFGSVAVADDEEITGQAIAILGSAHIDGEVRDQVVAVLGSVYLGPQAVVHGDIVSVGGNVRRAPGAQVMGGVTEVSLQGLNDTHIGPWVVGLSPFFFFDRIAAVPRLMVSTFRLGLLILLALISLVIARPTVEQSAARISDNPLKALLVGLLAQALLLPTLIIVVFVLAISFVGIPLLFLLPFALLVLVLMAIAGFSGTACAVGQWARGRLGIAGGSAFADVVVGVIVILLPLMVGRMLALAGWPLTPVVFLILAAAFAIELLAWSSGFGAVLTNVFLRWKAKRAARTTLQAPPLS
jgi:hypothetical protein